MPEIVIPSLNRQALRFSLPNHWRLLQVAEPGFSPPLANVTDVLEQALSNPAGCSKIENLAGPESSVVIVVEDLTRRTPLPLFLPVLARRLAACGVKREKIQIVMAIGQHRPMRQNEIEKRVGSETARTFTCVNSAPCDPGQNMFIGQTPAGAKLRVFTPVAQADLRIFVGEVVPHLQTGFTGGFKLVFPGTSALETIHQLHNAGMPERNQRFAGQRPSENPMRREIEAAGKLLPGKSLSVGCILNGQDQVVDLLAGAPTVVEDELAARARKCFGIPLSKEADIVITSSFPFQHDLIQSFKGLLNVRFATRRDGVLIGLLDPETVSELEEFKTNLSGAPLERVRKVLRWIPPSVIVSLIRPFAPSVKKKGKFLTLFFLELIQHNWVLIYCPALVEKGLDRMFNLEVYGELELLFQRAQELARVENPSVLVFPQGGISFPQLKELT